MWSDIYLAITVVAIMGLGLYGLYNIWKAAPPTGTLRDDQLEALIYSKHLQKDHYYLFVWDARGISQQKANDFSNMLKMKGFDTGFMRTRGIPPVVYDLKRPEEPVEGIENE